MNRGKVALRILATPIISLILSLSACLPESLEVDGLNGVKPELVIASSILPDTTIAIVVTRTFGALDAGPDKDLQQIMTEIGVNDAVVTITVGGVSYQMPLYQSGIYEGSGVPIIPGQLYELHVNSPTFGEVMASTMILHPVLFDTVSVVRESNQELDFARVSMTFTDPAETNFYMINVHAAAKEALMDNFINPNNYIRIKDDTDFNGSPVADKFTAWPNKFRAGDSVAVTLSNVNADYYRYLLARGERHFGLLEFFSEPVTYPSNIQGGRGFFSLQIPDVRVLVLE